jgi:hypothetical protein
VKHYATPVIATVIVFGCFSALATPSYAHTDSWSHDSNGISLDHGDALIHGNDATIARVTPHGMLFIAGKPQTVTPAQRQQLSRYLATVKDMQAKGMALAGQAGDFAGSIVSEVLGGLFSGESEAQIDKKAHERAQDFSQRALPICQDAQTLRQIQETLVASLPAFKPYAIIPRHDMSDCQHDISSNR